MNTKIEGQRQNSAKQRNESLKAHFKDEDNDDILFIIDNSGNKVFLNNTEHSFKLIDLNDKLFIAEYTNKSGNTWKWSINIKTGLCEGISQRLFSEKKMKSVLLGDSNFHIKRVVK